MHSRTVIGMIWVMDHLLLWVMDKSRKLKMTSNICGITIKHSLMPFGVRRTCVQVWMQLLPIVQQVPIATFSHMIRLDKKPACSADSSCLVTNQSTALMLLVDSRFQLGFTR